MKALPQPNVSFCGEFSNLKFLSLQSVTLNDDQISMVSKLSLLEFIFLHKCKMVNGHLFKLLEGHTTIKEIQLWHCKFSDAISIKFPSQMKRFIIEHNNVFELDASDCTQLEYL